tara:strand:+ start:951 stop:1667 length:717 start_codon:yes stop_codon:yes gene_type:complete
LSDLRSEGITPDDAEVIWLADLRRKVDRSPDGSIAWVMGAPIEYGGETWFPLHRLAESWYSRAFNLLTGNPNQQIWSYLLAHARSAEGDTSLRTLMTVPSIVETLTDWSASLAIHDEQLGELGDRLRELDGDSDIVPPPETDGAPLEEVHDDLPGFVAAMCRAYPGVSPEFWLTGCPAHTARQMLQNAASGSGSWALSAERAEAIENFLKGIKWVWKNHGVDITKTGKRTRKRSPSNG